MVASAAEPIAKFLQVTFREGSEFGVRTVSPGRCR